MKILFIKVNGSIILSGEVVSEVDNGYMVDGSNVAIDNKEELGIIDLGNKVFNDLYKYYIKDGELELKDEFKPKKTDAERLEELEKENLSMQNALNDLILNNMMGGI